MPDAASAYKPMKAIWDDAKKHLLGPLAFACLLAYSSFIWLPAFNADDIIQSQPVSGDYNTFLAQGRWGYFFIYKVIQGANPLGPAAMILGALLLLASSLIASYEMPIRNNLARSYFVLVSSISLYWAQCFSFDSTRISYPVSILLSILAYALIRRARYIVGIICLITAAAIFQASVQVFLTFVSATALLALCRKTPVGKVFKSIVKYVACLSIALALYLLSIKISSLFTGIPLASRSEVNPLAAITASGRIMKLFSGHSLPKGSSLPYFTSILEALNWILMIGFIATIIKSANKATAIAFIAFFALLIISPFALAFATPLDEFSPRALIGFSLVTASYTGITLDIAIDDKSIKRTRVISTISALYLFFTAVQVNALGFDEYLASRNDLLATNRIISRIETVIADSNHTFEGQIPIVVRYRNPSSLAPRGVVGTSRGAPWSKEWIFRQLDPRFIPASPELSNAILKNAPELKWPDRNSVYVINNVVVVLID